MKNLKKLLAVAVLGLVLVGVSNFNNGVELADLPSLHKTNSVTTMDLPSLHKTNSVTTMDLPSLH